MTLSEENQELLNKLKTLVELADDQSNLMQAEIEKLAIKEEIKEEHDNDDLALKDVTENIATMNVIRHSPKLRKFLKGENFAQYCERFKEFAYISKIQDKKLYLYFLQHMDDETYSVLKLVSLSESEQADPELFCDEFKREIYGEECTTLKAEVLDCKQLSSESIEKYAYRLREKGIIAFSEENVANQNCLIAFIKGVRDPYIGRKLNEEELHSFSEAVKLAKRLEAIERLYGDKKETDNVSILKETQVSFVPNTSDGQRERYNRSRSPPHRSRPTSRERYNRSQSPSHNRSASYDSRNSDYSFISPSRPSRDRSVSRSRSESSPRWTQSRSGSRSFSRRSQGSEFNNSRPGGNNNSFRSRSQNRFVPQGRNNFQKRCWHCNKVGHIRRQCWSLQSQNSSFQRGRNNAQPFNNSRWNETQEGTHNTSFNGSNRSTSLN